MLREEEEKKFLFMLEQLLPVKNVWFGRLGLFFSALSKVPFFMSAFSLVTVLSLTRFPRFPPEAF